MKKKLFAFMIVIFSFDLKAGECIVSIDRQACSGKREEMLALFSGKNPTFEKQVFNSSEDCLKFAQSLSSIESKGVIASKHVTAKFEGKPLQRAFLEPGDCY